MQKARPSLSLLLSAFALAACTADPASVTSPSPRAPSLTVTASSGGTTVVVTNDDVARQQENTPPTANWVYYTRTPTSVGTFRTGPATPPSGVGSFEISTPTGADKGFLFNFDYIGTPLSAFSAIGYSTYRTAGDAQQVTALNIQVDVNGSDPGGFTTLVFEPVYNPDQGAVVSGQWQQWNAFGSAIWWSTRAIPGVCAFTCYVSWNDIVAANPNAVVVGGLGLNQGSGNPNLISASDALTIGVNGSTVTYDFEPYRVATTADACKNGGYQNLKRADGSAFKNQGDCIQYVKTGK